MSIRRRIILGFLFLVAGSFSFITYIILTDIRPGYLEAAEDHILDTAELLAALISPTIQVDGSIRATEIEDAMRAVSRRKLDAMIFDTRKTSVDLRVYITNAHGILLYDSSHETLPGADFSQWRDVYLTLRGQYGARSTRTDPDDPTTSIIYVAAPIIKDGIIYGVVSVGKPQDSVTPFMAIAQQKLLLSIAIVGAAACLLAIAMSTWVTWPLNRLTRYVRSIREGNTRPLPRLGTSEIAALGQAISDMQSELDGKNYIEDYVRALTHEMKSPLTGIKGAGEILREDISEAQRKRFLDNIEYDVNRLQSLVERMLQISRLENVREINKSRFPAEGFFHALAESFQHVLEKKAIRLELDIEKGLEMEGDRLLLEQAVASLVSNAADFSPPGGVISILAGEAGKQTVITIRDQGSGIPDFALDKVFDKFFSLKRPGTQKKSTGLGLPFVREVLSLHQGNVSLVNRNPGLEVRIRLPL